MLRQSCRAQVTRHWSGSLLVRGIKEVRTGILLPPPAGIVIVPMLRSCPGRQSGAARSGPRVTQAICRSTCPRSAPAQGADILRPRDPRAGVGRQGFEEDNEVPAAEVVERRDRGNDQRLDSAGRSY